MLVPEEKRLWLFDLAHGNLEGMAVVQGFVKHYAMAGKSTEDVIQEIVFHTIYGERGARTAKETLQRELVDFAYKDFEETRRITEIKAIVASVRAGYDVQIAYANPDEEDAFDPMVRRACY